MIVAGYPAYSNGSAHYGIDICIYDEDGKLDNTRGAPIYAAQDGEVVISKMMAIGILDLETIVL